MRMLTVSSQRWESKYVEGASQQVALVGSHHNRRTPGETGRCPETPMVCDGSLSRCRLGNADSQAGEKRFPPANRRAPCAPQESRGCQPTETSSLATYTRA